MQGYLACGLFASQKQYKGCILKDYFISSHDSFINKPFYVSTYAIPSKGWAIRTILLSSKF